MQLIIISGFLGSGKTSLLLAVARQLAEGAGKKVAVIENEVGDIGIDDDFLKENGLNVREIYSGCVCCSLRGDLITTLLALEREYDPEVVLLEPSGVAGPKQVANIFQGYGGEIDGKLILNLIDASRFHELEDFSIPIIRDGIEVADVIVVTKTDLISETALSGLIQRISAYQPKARILPVSLLDDDDVDGLVTEINRACSAGFGLLKEENGLESARRTEEHNHHHDLPEPRVFALEEKLQFSEAKKSNELIAEYTASLEKLTVQLKDAGATIGHLKIMLNAGKQGYLVLSVTSADHPAQRQGCLVAKLAECLLRINVIVYGVDENELAELAGKEFNH